MRPASRTSHSSSVCARFGPLLYGRPFLFAVRFGVCFIQLSSGRRGIYMRIAFLGLGKMGSAVARHLLNAGHELTLWNRTAAHAEPLSKLGATVASSPSEAVAHSEAAFTMVMDDAALEDVMFTSNALKAMPTAGIHVSLSTISVRLSDRLTEAHRAQGS